MSSDPEVRRLAISFAKSIAKAETLAQELIRTVDALQVHLNRLPPPVTGADQRDGKEGS